MGKANPNPQAAVADWEETFGSLPPAYLSVDFMARAIAHEEQCRSHGGLPDKLRRELRSIIEGQSDLKALGRKLRAGAHLVREWNGRTYQVEVVECGYLLDGGSWPSLSVVAKHITRAFPFQLRKRGVETRIILADAPPETDDTLIRDIARAQSWFERVRTSETFDDIARTSDTSKRRIQQMIGFAFLAPNILRRVMDGDQPAGFTSDWCKRNILPSHWAEQRVVVAAL